MRWLIAAAVAATALIGASVAAAVGPWPGLAQSVRSAQGDVRYTAARSGDSTTVRALRVGAGDRVRVELARYDHTRGRIVSRA